LAGLRARAVEAEQRHVGGLVGRGVLAGGLAQGLRIGGDVEDVVDHLERQADGRAVVAQRRQRGGADTLPQAAPISTLPCSSAPVFRRCISRSCVFVERDADAGQVDRLAAGHALAARGAREQAAQRGLGGGGNLVALGRQQLEGQRLQRVAGQQRIGLAELHVHRGLAAAQHVVVHAGQVVVHQRIGVDQFGGAGRAQRRGLVAADRFAGGQHQQRPQPLAAVEHGIAHGVAQQHGRIDADPARQRRSTRPGGFAPARAGRRPNWRSWGRRSFGRPDLQAARVEHLDLVFDRLQLVAAEGEQCGAALVAAEQLVERQLARFEFCNQLFQFLSPAS
jgi:hypothetical protein